MTGGAPAAGNRWWGWNEKKKRRIQPIGRWRRLLPKTYGFKNYRLKTYRLKTYGFKNYRRKNRFPKKPVKICPFFPWRYPRWWFWSCPSNHRKPVPFGPSDPGQTRSKRKGSTVFSCRSPKMRRGKSYGLLRHYGSRVDNCQQLSALSRPQSMYLPNRTADSPGARFRPGMINTQLSNGVRISSFPS